MRSRVRLTRQRNPVATLKDPLAIVLPLVNHLDPELPIIDLLHLWHLPAGSSKAAKGLLAERTHRRGTDRGACGEAIQPLAVAKVGGRMRRDGEMPR